MNGVRGKLRHDKVKTFPCAFGLNKKGVMDKEEFEKYLSRNVTPLYPDTCGTISKSIVIKIVSEPGRMNPEWMA